jgi:hypothetical protein
MAPDRVYLVDEDDAGGVPFGLGKEISHPGGAYPHKHLHKIGTTYTEKRDTGLSGNGLGQ